jgi:hypothetical protein
MGAAEALSHLRAELAVLSAPDETFAALLEKSCADLGLCFDDRPDSVRQGPVTAAWKRFGHATRHSAGVTSMLNLASDISS